MKIFDYYTLLVMVKAEVDDTAAEHRSRGGNAVKRMRFRSKACIGCDASVCIEIYRYDIETRYVPFPLVSDDRYEGILLKKKDIKISSPKIITNLANAIMLAMQEFFRKIVHRERILYLPIRLFPKKKKKICGE